jgi:hypothetical protein
VPEPFELSGFLKTERAIEPFIARISAPRASADGADFSCSVHAPALVKRDKEIFGASAEQARKLALHFLRSLLEGKNLVDKAGRKVDLARLG